MTRTSFAFYSDRCVQLLWFWSQGRVGKGFGKGVGEGVGGETFIVYLLLRILATLSA